MTGVPNDSARGDQNFIPPNMDKTYGPGYRPRQPDVLVLLEYPDDSQVRETRVPFVWAWRGWTGSVC